MRLAIARLSPLGNRIYTTLLGHVNPTDLLSKADGDALYAPITSSGVWGGISGTLSNQTDLQAALDSLQSAIDAVGGSWGSITGTLSAQTDLQSALNLKAPLASPDFTGTVNITATAPNLEVERSGSGSPSSIYFMRSGFGSEGQIYYDSTGLHIADYALSLITFDGSVAVTNGDFSVAGYLASTGHYRASGGTHYFRNADGSLIYGYVHSGGFTTGGSITAATGDFSSYITVADDAYDATTWNASRQVPTKDAVRDKIEGLSSTYAPIAHATSAITGSGHTMATARLLGRTTATTGAIEELTAGATLTLSSGSLGVASVPNAATFNNGGSGAASGTTFDGSAARTISYNTIGAAASTHTHAYTDVVSVPTGSLIYRKTAGTGAAETQTLATLKTDLGLTGTNSGDQTITLIGNVTGSGTGSFATTIASNVVTNAMLATVATATFKGRTTASTGNVEDLTVTQATALLNVFGADTGSGGVKGLVPATVTGDSAKFLKGDGTWATPAGGGGTTTNAVTFNNAGSGAASGTTFDGSVARTISYNSIGAQPLDATLTALAGATWSAGTQVLTLTATDTITLKTVGSSSGNILDKAAGDALYAALAGATFTGKLNTLASATGGAGLNLPHGAAPTSPVNGDVWTTTTGTFWRINGATKTAAYTDSNITGSAGSVVASATFNNGGSGVASGTTFDGSTARTISYNTLGAAPLASPTFTGTVTTAASATGGAGINLPHGAAPTSPVNGDVWTTTTAMLARINGASKTLAFTDSNITGSAGSTTAALTFNNGGSGDASGTTFNGATARTLSYNSIGAAPTASPTFTGTVNAATLVLSGTISATNKVDGVKTLVNGLSTNSERHLCGTADYAFTATNSSVAKALVAATASTVYTIKKGTVASPTTIGTFTFAASGTTATTSITAGSVSSGDFVWIEAPATADATLADVSFTVRA
jgi:hypothetical protein